MGVGAKFMLLRGGVLVALVLALPLVRLVSVLVLVFEVGLVFLFFLIWKVLVQVALSPCCL